MKDNYFESEQLAHDLKMFKPMLCPSGMKWKDYKAGGKKAKKVVYPILVSAKLDGARANMGFTGETFLVNASLITDTAIVPGTYPMLSRESRPWLNFEHIRDDHYFQEFLRDYPNIILDGEMYNHDFKDEFEGLISVFRKQKPTPEQRIISAGVSKFYVYDIYDKAKPNLTALERQKVLIGIYENYFKSCDLFVPVLSKVVKNEAEFDAFHEDCMDKGYEGTIARLIDSPYGIDSRSGDLLKRKDVFDCEFTITGVIEGEGNKAGTAQKVVIELGTAEGMNEDDLAKLDELGTQKAGMARGWDNAKCKVVLENPDRYIGKVGTFEYFGITNHGKLRFPKFKALREPFSY
jgi:ATP-dependent DNA ligase